MTKTKIQSTQLQSRTRSTITAILLFILITLLIAHLAAVEIFPLAAAASNSLPDLGPVETDTPSLQPSINAQAAGLTYQAHSQDKIFTLAPQYSKQNGLALAGSLAQRLSPSLAVGVVFTAGVDKNEWLVNGGFDFMPKQRLILSLGQLRQNLDFKFISGSEKTQITQANAALSYQYFLGQDWLNSVEVNTYISHTGSEKLSDKTYFIDTIALYELWRDPRRIAGGSVSGLQARMLLTPNSKAMLKLGLGAERLSYDLLSGKETSSSATGSAEFNQQLARDFSFRASAYAAAAQNRYALGLGRSFNSGQQLAIDVATIIGRDGNFNDRQLWLSYSQSLGSNTATGLAMSRVHETVAAVAHVAMNPLATTPATLATTASSPAPAVWASALLTQVAQRPSFLPAQVIAKIDSSAAAVRLIAIDKTSVPAGSTIDSSSGIISAPTGVAVSGIAAITLNGLAFVNSGQFSLAGSNMLVNPSLITQPAAGVVDTYVVNMNNSAGGGSTLATVRVARGSVKIDSMVLSNAIAPSLSGFSLTAASVVFGASAPGIVAPTSSSNGSISYSSANSAVASISGGVIAITGTGSTLITATQLANGNYAAVTTVTTLTVTLPTGYVTQGGLTWSPINSTRNWDAAASSCAALNTSSVLGYGSGWRLPTTTELLALYAARSSGVSPAGWRPAGWVFDNVWSSTIVVTGVHQYVGLHDGRAAQTLDGVGLYSACVH